MIGTMLWRIGDYMWTSQSAMAILTARHPSRLDFIRNAVDVREMVGYGINEDGTFGRKLF